MDPITGASTWALGNQRCTKKSGNFTKKANTKLKNKNLDLTLISVETVL